MLHTGPARPKCGGSIQVDLAAKEKSRRKRGGAEGGGGGGGGGGKGGGEGWERWGVKAGDLQALLLQMPSLRRSIIRYR